MRLDEAGGFVFDVDGTLIHRTDHGFEALPGAREVLEAIRGSGRPFVLFTNASHVAPSAIAQELRADGLPVGDDEVLTPICSAISHLARHHAGRSVLMFGSDAARERVAASGVRLLDGDDAEVVFVAHPPGADVAFAALETAARAVLAGAPLLTGSFTSAYAGAHGPIFSRGAMLTAAIAKATGGGAPEIVGKPSRAAVREVVDRLGVPSERVVVTGDDLDMDIALGHLGGSHTILVRSGISGALDLDALEEGRRPHEAVDGVHQLLDRL